MVGPVRDPFASASSSTETTEHTTLLEQPQPRRPNPMNRTILVNKPQQGKFKNNAVRTTKYNVLTFFPLFLFESFRRYSNAFFLFIACLQQIPDVSPTGRWTTLVPLTFILFVSACKEIFEDFKRRLNDNDVNNRNISVLRGDTFEQIRWRQLKVGDVVRVCNNEEFPADLILLSSSEPQGVSYIETANLDGETNLKTRSALLNTTHLLSEADAQNFSASIECESPNRMLYEFTGNITIANSVKALGPDQLLLRGSKLKNTEWIYGVVIYTGHDSKLMQNSKKGAILLLKRSQMDEFANHQIIIMFGLLLVVCLISGSGNAIWRKHHAGRDWYLHPLLEAQNFGFSFLTFFILYNNLIPISLQVTLEMVRFFQTLFIGWDYEMYDPISDTPAVARTSNLNEDLGQIKYVFSDKTGTVTENKMIFRQCSIGGLIYGNPQSKSDTFVDTTMGDTLRSDIPAAKQIHDLLLAITLCQTVVPEVNPNDAGRPFYLASSPDEAALVNAAAFMGYVFLKRHPNKIIAYVKNYKTEKMEMLEYELLDVLDFDSDRKRMSVIIRMPSGQLMLFCKGADTVICERLGPDQPYLGITMKHLEDFANLGLRTLCVASVELSSAQYTAWKRQYVEASTAMEKRKEKVAEVSDLIEQHLTLLGATAIEDRLQEGVPACIAKLLEAGIKMWILTGDKMETAINIGHSCNLLTHDMPLFLVKQTTAEGVKKDIAKFRADLGASLGKENHIGLVIDGKSLYHALSPDCRKQFLELAVSMKSVICCRVSPMQKADVITLVRSGFPKDITLAIGDGANDVAMIQTAHVGVGISGKEGLQAVCASDYAISQFRFLQRLLLVHGAWSHERIAKLILYCYHKNICLYIMQFYFAIASSFSGQTMFERWTIGLYNLVFTAAPPFILGIFDRSTSAATRMEYPKLYEPGQRKVFFNFYVFWGWIITSLCHAAIIFGITYGIFVHETLWSNGMNSGGFVFGAAAYTYVIVVVCMKAGLEMNSWTLVSHIGIWGSIVSWFVFLPIYANLWPHFMSFGEDFVGVDRALFGSWLFWLGLLFVPVITLLFDICFKTLKNVLMPSIVDEVRQIERNSRRNHRTELEGLDQLASRPISDIPPADLSPTAPQRGFAFSQDENGAVRQSKLAMSEDTETRYQERLARRSRESLMSGSLGRGSPKSLGGGKRSKPAGKVKNL